MLSRVELRQAKFLIGFDRWQHSAIGIACGRARPSMLYCGDQQRGKGIAATLIRDIGFDPIDLGSLSSARYTEPLAMIIAHLAYGGSEGPEIAYRFERFQK